MFNRFFSTNQTETKSPLQGFIANLPINIPLATFTIPTEKMTLNVIFTRLNDPHQSYPPYLKDIKEKGLRAFFTGGISRVSYCLTGNLATVLLIDDLGIVGTAAAKNSLLPFFLGSNASQMSFTFSQMIKYIAKGSVDPVTHASFFLRNLVANTCLWPGIAVRDKIYQTTGEKNTKLATIAGWSTSLIAATFFNAFMKPFFTGNSPFSIRFNLACKLPAKLPLMLRESASLGLFFFNTSPKKAPTQTEDPRQSLKNK